MLDGAKLNLLWPFYIPPEGSKVAVPASGMEAGVAVGNADGHAWDAVSDGKTWG